MRQNGIGGNWIIGQQNGLKVLWHTVKWSITLHCDDAVCDDELRPNRRANVENAFVDSSPVKDILRPAVAAARNNAKHVLHAERDSGPMMRFHFRHGDDEVRLENGSWKPQVPKPGIVGLNLRFDQLVTIEIHERDIAMRKLVAEAVLVQEQIRVAMMTWAFANH